MAPPLDTPLSLVPELYKFLTRSSEILKTLTNLLNDTLQNGNIPDGWKTSNTKLIPKVKKPKVNELRPIALLDYSYKILMGILKNKITDHLIANNSIDDQQTGATSKRRVTENIFILDYCVNKSFNMKKQLYVLSVDYMKAFDSILRLEMIEVLQSFRIHPLVINIIASLYMNDKTNLYLNEQKLVKLS